MRLQIRMSNGDDFEIADLPDEDALALADALQNGYAPTLMLTMENGEPLPPTLVYLQRQHLSSMELT